MTPTAASFDTPPDGTPCLGLIVPPAHGREPNDGPALYGARVRFIARGLGLPEISARGYEEVIDHVVALARELTAEGAQAVSLMGTSLSFFRGARFTEELQQALAEATGLPASTMSHAILRALHALGLRRVAVATAYIDDVNDRLASFLRASGVEATVVRGLSITGVEAVGRVPTEALVSLCEEVWHAGPGADGILISCGGLLTLETIRIVEARLDIPVVSSSPAGFWDVMRVAGLDSRSPGHGRLFEI